MEEEKMSYRDTRTTIGMILAIVGSTFVSIFLTLIISFIGGFVLELSGSVDAVAEFNSIYEEYLGTLIMVMTMIIMITIYCFIIGKQRVLSILQGFKKSKVWLFALIASVILVGGSTLYTFLISLIETTEENANQESIITMINNCGTLSFLYVVILAPIVEEIGFRYFIFGGLKSKDKKTAYLVSALIFAVMHFSVLIGAEDVSWLSEVLAFPTYLGAGLLLCYSYDKTNYLACPIIIHIINNLVSFLLVVL